MLQAAPGDVGRDGEGEHDREQAEQRNQPQGSGARGEDQLPEVADQAGQAVPRWSASLPPQLDRAVSGPRNDPGERDVEVDVGSAIGGDHSGDLALDQAKAIIGLELAFAQEPKQYAMYSA